MLQLACRDNAQRDAWLDAIKVLLFQHFDPVPAKDDRPATPLLTQAAPLLTPAAPMLSPVAPLLSKVSAPGTGGHMPQLLAMLEHPLSPAVLTHAVAAAHHGGEGRGAHSSKRSDEGASQASPRNLTSGVGISRACEGTLRVQSAPLPIISEAPVLAERGDTAATRGTEAGGGGRRGDAGTVAVEAVAGAASGAPGVAGGAVAVGDERQHAQLQVDLNVLGPYEVELKLLILAA